MPYTCKYCGKTFQTARQLGGHISLVHRKEKKQEKKQKRKSKEYMGVGVQKGEDEEVMVETPEGIKIRRTILLDPQIIQLYEWYLDKSGENVTLDEFINNTIIEYFQELGLEVAIVRRR
jgi:hypothetical protein